MKPESTRPLLQVRTGLPSISTLSTNGGESPAELWKAVWVDLDVLTEEVKFNNRAEEKTMAKVGNGASTQ